MVKFITISFMATQVFSPCLPEVWQRSGSGGRPPYSNPLQAFHLGTSNYCSVIYSAASDGQLTLLKTLGNARHALACSDTGSAVPCSSCLMSFADRSALC